MLGLPAAHVAHGELSRQWRHPMATTQEHRGLGIETPLGADVLLRRSISGLPGVIEPFQKRQDILDRVINGYFLDSDFVWRVPHAVARTLGPVGV